MDAKGIQALLRNYRKWLEKDLERIEKLKDKAVEVGLQDGAQMGDTIMDIDRQEMVKIEEAIKCLEDLGEEV